MKFGLVSAIVLATQLATVVPGFADEDSGVTGITGKGTIEIQRLPETMRLYVTIQAKAVTLKGALAGLKHRTDNARKKILALGAKPESIKVEPAQVVTDNTETQQRLMLHRQVRIQNNKKKEEKPAEARPIHLSAVFIADIPLTSKQPEAMLIEAIGLQESINAMDLGGRAAATELSAAEKKMQEEIDEAGMGNDTDDSEKKLGDPIYVFVSPISEAEQTRAVTEAFRKARTDADKLAKAVGVELKGMTSISRSVDHVQQEEQDQVMSSGANSDYISLRSRLYSKLGEGDEKHEAFGPIVGPVKCTVTVSVGFRIGSAGK